MNPFLLLTIIFFLIVGLFITSSAIPEPVRVLVRLQTAFFFISYFMRPLVLITVQPQSRLDDSLADIRYNFLGYEKAFSEVLPPVVWGLGAYLLLLLLAKNWLVSKFRERPNNFLQKLLEGGPPRWIVVAYFVGWVGRLMLLPLASTGFRSAIETITWLSLVGVVGLIFSSKVDTAKGLIILGALGLGELIWSVLFSSKTPIIGFATVVIVYFSILGFNKARITITALLALVTFFVFPLIQNLKSSEVAEKVAQVDKYYPLWSQPLLPILRRFDLLSAVTDATYYRDTSWLRPAEYFGQLFANLLPQQLLGYDKVGAGSYWSVTVRSSSTGYVNPDVSLAEGPIAEGLMLSGIAGVLFSMLVLVCAVVSISHLLHFGKTFAFTVAAIFLSFPVLFERGSLGISEYLGKALQVWLLVVVIRAFTSLDQKLSESSQNRRKGSVHLAKG